MDTWMDGCVNVYMDGYMDRCMNTWVDELEQAQIGHGRFLSSSGLLKLYWSPSPKSS